MNDIVSIGSGFLSSLFSSEIFQKIEDVKVKKSLEHIAYTIDKFVDEVDVSHRDSIQTLLLEYLCSYIKADNGLDEKITSSYLEECQKQLKFYLNNDERYKIESCVNFINNELMSLMSLDGIVIWQELKYFRSEFADVVSRISKEVDQQTNQEMFRNNQKEEFVRIWKDILFLNKGEENNQLLTLENLYILPNYSLCKYGRGRIEKIEGIVPLDEKISEFLSNDNKKGMIIYGIPGIGKSSLVNFIAGNEERLNKYRRKIIYISVQNLDVEVIQKESLLESIIRFLECPKEKFKNCVCILDGLDEIQSNVDINNVLGRFMLELPKQKIKTIITSRDNIVEYSNLGDRVLIIELELFTVSEIERFNCKYKKYRDVQFNVKEIKKNNIEVLGIPLMLYFVHALNLKINDVLDKSKLYNKVFSGIYDKCRIEYLDLNDQRKKESNWGMPVLVELSNKMKKDFDFIAQIIAFEIFKQDKESQDIKKIRSILENNTLLDENSKMRYPVSNFYQISANSIKFVHRSFYEYFLSEHLYITIVNNFDNSEVLVESLLPILKANYINNEIKDFLLYKIQTDKELSNKSSVYFYMQKIVNLIFETAEINYKNEEKARIFFNMLLVLEIFHKIHDRGIYKDIYRKYPDRFIRLLMNYQIYKGNECGKLNLQYFDFGKASLSFVNLSDSDLSNCYFDDANLDYAQLVNCYISKTQFSRVNLNYTLFNNSSIVRVRFNRCELCFTSFLNASLSQIKFGEDEFGSGLNVVLIDSINYQQINMDLSNSFVCNLERELNHNDDFKSSTLNKYNISQYNNFIFYKENMGENLE